MQCPRCAHLNVSSFRFCERCLAPLKAAGAADDVVSRFFDEADLNEAGSGDASRGAVMPARFDLPWKADVERLALHGRDAELAAAADRMRTGLAAQRFTAFVVQGEAGSGRSRLLAAARDRLLKQQPNTRVLVTTGQGAHRAYALIERFLRLRFDIPDYLGGTIAGERFERTVEAFYGDPAGAEVARTCGPMLGFHFWNEHDIDFEDRVEQARRAREALYNLFTRDLADPPTVIAVDDAGEADAESLDFLRGLTEDGLDVPAVLVLLTDRRGEVRRPWLAELPSVAVLPLQPAVMAGIAAKALQGVAGVDDAAIATLVDHANGRPGTLLDEIEGLSQHGAITEQSGPDGKVSWTLQPARMQELVQKGGLHSNRGGRFDGLSDFQLQIASMGAVFGVRFWLGGVVAMLRADAAMLAGSTAGVRTASELGRDDTPEKVKAACQALLERGLVVPERSGVLPHESCYRLVEEADRDSLLELHDPKTLQRLSQRAAVWLQMVAAERAGELSDILAPLWLTAGDPVHAAHVYLRAGERALDEFRHEPARTFLEKARELAPPDMAHVHTEAVLGLGRLAEFDGRWQEAEDRYRDALQLAWRFRARGRGAKALQRLGRMFRSQGKVQQALDQLVPAMHLYEQIGDVRGLGTVCDDIGRTYWVSGRTEPATLFLKRAAQYRERIGDKAGQAATLTNLGIVSMSLGHLEQARAWLDQAVQMQRDGRNPFGLIESLNAYGALLVTASEADAAVIVMQEAYELAKRVGNRRIQAMMQNNLGEVLLLSGRVDDGETLLYKAVEGAGRLADHALLSDAARNLAVAARGRNDHDRALKWARRSVAAAQSSDVVRTRASSQRTLGEVLADQGDIDAADEAFSRAEEWLAQANEVHELQACLQVHAAFLVRVGRTQAAQTLLDRCDGLTATAATA